jgi:hypothetical protein
MSIKTEIKFLSDGLFLRRGTETLTSSQLMDKADTDFLTILFKENNELRTNVCNLNRKV